MQHTSTSLLMEDMEDDRSDAKLSRFASYASGSGSIRDSSMVLSVAKSKKKKGKIGGGGGGSTRGFAPPLVSSFESALDERHRDHMAKPVGPKFFAENGTMTSNDVAKLEFETMSEYNHWVKVCDIRQ